MKRATLLLCLLLPTLAQAGWKGPDNQPIADNESRRSAGNFGASLLITPDEKEFQREWDKQPGPPSLRTTDKARIGQSVSAMLLFHGCRADKAGHCNVTARFFVVRPDGQRDAAGDGLVWTQAPLPEGRIQLSQSNLSMAFDASDAPGEYTLIAEVDDKIAGTTLKLAQTLQLSNDAGR
jgi:hypothetical protein